MVDQVKKTVVKAEKTLKLSCISYVVLRQIGDVCKQWQSTQQLYIKHKLHMKW